VAAVDFFALSRNYFDQIHFAVNCVAVLPGFFFFKKCVEAGKAVAMYMVEQSLPHIHFPGCHFRHPLIILFCFLAVVFFNEMGYY
jgi:hypothetical protein